MRSEPFFWSCVYGFGVIIQYAASLQLGQKWISESHATMNTYARMYRLALRIMIKRFPVTFSIWLSSPPCLTECPFPGRMLTKYQWRKCLCIEIHTDSTLILLRVIQADTKFPSVRSEFLNAPTTPLLASQNPLAFLKSSEDFDSYKARYVQMSALIPEILKAAIDNNHFKLR